MRTGVAALVLVALLGFGALGCGSRVGLDVAARIRTAQSPLVMKVVFREPNALDPPEVNVWLNPGVSEDEAVQLWCQVIVPAGGTPEADTAVVVWNDSGTEIMAADPACD